MSEIKCSKCGKICASLRGWKQHCSAAHGGYTDTEMAQATGVVSYEGEDAKSRMAAYAETLPADATQVEGELKSETQVAAMPVAPAPEPEKRIKATPKRLKKILGDIPASVLKAQGIELDSDDEEAMEEAAEFLAGVAGIEFSVPESKYVVKNRFAAVLWVVGVTVLVWVKHRTPELWKAVFGPEKKEGEKKGPQLVE